MTDADDARARGRRDLLRHTLATLAYRGAKAVRDAPASFADFRAGENTRTPVQVLAHVGDLLDWALGLARGEHVWREAAPLPWPQEVGRFHEGLARLDAYLASDAPLGWTAERLFQGPIADALTHVGQITMLRRLFGSAVKGENYAKAEIHAGRVGEDQASPRLEFD
jgi:hypothetical protein